ncbi:RHS repeat-associated core domain-containing protein [Allohahella sp. A8]|uniref:RHS repeat-associated core domain-containing protein n=1 Tax=Allohahella sp. A8 TaxID=3141461 RepID=UPI003A7F7758
MLERTDLPSWLVNLDCGDSTPPCLLVRDPSSNVLDAVTWTKLDTHWMNTELNEDQRVDSILQPDEGDTVIIRSLNAVDFISDVVTLDELGYDPGNNTSSIEKTTTDTGAALRFATGSTGEVYAWTGESPVLIGNEGTTPVVSEPPAWTLDPSIFEFGFDQSSAISATTGLQSPNIAESLSSCPGWAKTDAPHGCAYEALVGNYDLGGTGGTRRVLYLKAKHELVLIHGDIDVMVPAKRLPDMLIDYQCGAEGHSPCAPIFNIDPAKFAASTWTLLEGVWHSIDLNGDNRRDSLLLLDWYNPVLIMSHGAEEFRTNRIYPTELGLSYTSANLYSMNLYDLIKSISFIPQSHNQAAQISFGFGGFSKLFNTSFDGTTSPAADSSINLADLFARVLINGNFYDVVNKPAQNNSYSEWSTCPAWKLADGVDSCAWEIMEGYGDLNNDGVKEKLLYLKPRKEFVLIAGPINTPLVFTDLPGILINQDCRRNDAGCGYIVGPDQSFINSVAWRHAGVKIYAADLDGDGVRDMILQPGSGPLTIVYGGAPVYSVINPLGDSGFDDSVKLRFSEVDGDRAEDLILDDPSQKDFIAVFGSNRILKEWKADQSYARPPVPTINHSKDGTYTAGATSGVLDVNALGSAGYSIPLVVSPGRGGIDPKLELSYSSGNPGGLLGVGWGITTSNAIARCSVGNAPAVTMTSADRFCFGGSPLVVINGRPYGSDGAVYRTEEDQFVRITSFGSYGGHGPDNFKVEYKSGELAYFGTTVDSKDLTSDSSAVESWLLKSLADRTGNERIYAYHNAASIEPSLAEIRYPGGHVAYGYNSYAKQEISYEGGSRTISRRQLVSLKTFDAAGDILRTYYFDYETGPLSELNRLTQLQECGADGSCLAPTTFEWSDSDFPGVMAFAGQRNTGICANGALDCVEGLPSSIKYADLDGNGKTDVCYWMGHGYNCRLTSRLPFDGPQYQIDLCATATAGDCNSIKERNAAIQFIDVDFDGLPELIVPIHNRVLKFFAGPNNPVARPASQLFACDGNSNCIPHSGVSFGDFTGDGRLSACWQRDAGMQCAIASAGASYGFGAGPTVYQLVQTSICSASGTAPGNCSDPITYKYTHPSFPGQTVEKTLMERGEARFNSLIDINGDGKSEIIFRSDEGLRVYTYTGGAFQELISYRTDLCANYDTRCSQRRGVIDDKRTHYRVSLSYTDVNGDGLTDICALNGSGISCYANTGRSFGDVIRSTAICNDTDPGCNGADNLSTIQFTDVNDDGLPDLVYRDDAKGVVAALNTPPENYLFGGFKVRVESGVCTSNSGDCEGDISHYGTVSVMDIEGDGAVDLIFRSDTGLETRSLNVKGYPDYLTQITTGLGHLTNIWYSTILDESVYTYNPQSSWYQGYPIVPVRSAVQVVKRVSTPDGLGGSKFKAYSYENLKTDVTNKGQLGFEKTTSVNVDTGDYVVNTYSHVLATAGRLIKSERYIRRNSNPFLMSRKTINYERRTGIEPSLRVSPYAPAAYPYVIQKTSETEREFDLLGGWTESVTQYIYTDVSGRTSGGSPNEPYYGEIYQTITTVTDDSGDHLTTTTTSQYDQNDPAQWMFGRVTRTDVTHEGVVDGLPLETVSKSSAWTYYTTHNRQGLIETETVEPDDEASRLTTLYEYFDFGLKSRVVSRGMAGTKPIERTISYTYDDFGRQTSMTNALGHTATMSSYANGLKHSSTTTNGQTTTWHYDAYGRPTLEEAADDNYSKTSYGGIAAGEPAWATYKTTSVDAFGNWSKTFFDVLGRQRESHSLDPFKDRVIVTRNEYDRIGRITRSYLPHFQNEYAPYTEVLEYDDLRRPTRTKDARGYTATTVYGTRQVTYINEKGQQRTEVSNVLGKPGSVVDQNGNRLVYKYDGFGNQISVTDETAGLVTTVKYNRRGFKTALNDPAKGRWTYVNNVFGELVLQTDAEQQKVCYEYDRLGRKARRIDNFAGTPQQALEGCVGASPAQQVTQWTYDTAANGLGLPSLVTGPDGFTARNYYDSLSRPYAEMRTIDGKALTTVTDFDNFSRPRATMYPGGLVVHQKYNHRSMLTSIVRDTGGIYWQAVETDAKGQVTLERLANGVITTSRGYMAETGWIESIVSSTPAALGDLQVNHYTYDALGNVSSRSDDLNNWSESAQYDELNRLSVLTETSITGTKTRNMRYSHNGNITFKSDVGDYEYGTACEGSSYSANSHAVSKAGGAQYCYNRNGDMVSGDGRTIEWTSFGKPKRITKGDASVEIFYGPDRSRFKRIDRTPAGTTETLYVGTYELVKTSSSTGSKTKERHSLGPVIITIDASDKVTEQYQLTDNLGSIVALVDVSKLVATADVNAAVTRQAFDAWGQRRFVDASVMSEFNLLNYRNETTDRGFTGHEHLDAVGLIHMNGRVYDAKLGRFLSADPFVQEPDNLQSLNRYSYVLNNPLSMTDPSGFFFKKLVKAIATAVLAPIVATLYVIDKALRELGRLMRKNKYLSQVIQIGGCIAFAPACAVIAAAVTYAVTDGDFQAAMVTMVTTAVQAGISAGIGEAFGDYTFFDMKTVGAVAAHSALGGAISVAGGGDFRSGAMAGGIGKIGGLASNTVISGESVAAVAGRTAIAAIFGGTASKLSGGSFANGAVTAAIQHLFNNERQSSNNASKRLNPLKIIGNLLPNWLRSNLVPRFTVYAGGDLTLVPGVGATGGLGSYFTTDNGISTGNNGLNGGDFEAGSFDVSGGGTGLDIDSSLGVGLAFGSFDNNFKGTSNNINLDYGRYALDLTFNGSNQWSGFRFSVTTGLPGLSTTTSTTNTRSY